MMITCVFVILHFVQIACLHVQKEVAFSEGLLLSSHSEQLQSIQISSQSEQFKKYQNSDWLEKSRPPKKSLLFWEKSPHTMRM